VGGWLGGWKNLIPRRSFDVSSRALNFDDLYCVYCFFDLLGFFRVSAFFSVDVELRKKGLISGKRERTRVTFKSLGAWEQAGKQAGSSSSSSYQMNGGSGEIFLNKRKCLLYIERLMRSMPSFDSCSRYFFSEGGPEFKILMRTWDSDHLFSMIADVVELMVKDGMVIYWEEMAYLGCDTLVSDDCREMPGTTWGSMLTLSRSYHILSWRSRDDQI
jgi:hypothetical protein